MEKQCKNVSPEVKDKLTSVGGHRSEVCVESGVRGCSYVGRDYRVTKITASSGPWGWALVM